MLRGFNIATLTGVTLSWKTELNRSISTMEDVMGCLNTNNFIFLLFYFSNFILIFFSCFFYFAFEQ